MKKLNTCIVVGSVLATIAYPLCAQTVISASAVAAGGITPGDAPGYPATISTAGSYILKSNLSPGSSIAIDVTANNVTLDLNGFVVDGGGTCATTPPQGNVCIPGGTPNELIRVAGSEVVIRNGILRGNTKGHGIAFSGTLPTNSILKDLIIVENTNNGIYAPNTLGISIIDVQSSQNGANGMALQTDALIKDTQTSYNNSGGIVTIAPTAAGILGSDVISSANNGVGISSLGSLNLFHAFVEGNAGYGTTTSYSGLLGHSIATGNTQGGFSISAAGYSSLVIDDVANQNGGYQFNLSGGCYQRLAAWPIGTNLSGGAYVTAGSDPCPP